MKMIGTDRPIHDAQGKAAGRTRYAADLSLPNLAHVAMIFSTVPHGYVVSVDASRALAMDGVYGVLHCLNTPEYCYNRYRSQFSQKLPAEERVFQNHVRFIGDRVGAVAARDLELVREDCLRRVEEHLSQAVQIAKGGGVTLPELADALTILYGDD